MSGCGPLGGWRLELSRGSSRKVLAELPLLRATVPDWTVTATLGGAGLRGALKASGHVDFYNPGLSCWVRAGPGLKWKGHESGARNTSWPRVHTTMEHALPPHTHKRRPRSALCAGVTGFAPGFSLRTSVVPLSPLLGSERCPRPARMGAVCGARRVHHRRRSDGWIPDQEGPPPSAPHFRRSLGAHDRSGNFEIGIIFLATRFFFYT